MPVTILDTGKTAMRRLGVLARGRDPKGSESADFLAAFQGMLDHMAATEAFGPLTNVLTSGAYEAGENERVTGAISVTLPATVTDTCTGEERSPKDRSIVIVAGTPETHIYDADLASWVSIRSLVLTDTTPLSSRYAEGLACMLAVQIAPEFSDNPPSPLVLETARRGRRAITRKDPFRAAPVATALLRTSNRMNYEVS